MASPEVAMSPLNIELKGPKLREFAITLTRLSRCAMPRRISSVASVEALSQKMCS